MDKNEFAGGMAYLEASTGVKFPKHRLEVWFDLLGDLAFEAFDRAIHQYCRTGENAFPMPATIRRLAGYDESNETQAKIAWARVRMAVRRYGSHRTIMFDDPRTIAAIHTIGGWRFLCDMKPEDSTWREKDFVSAYCSLPEAELLRLGSPVFRSRYDESEPTVVQIGLPYSPELRKRLMNHAKPVRLIETTAERIKGA